MADKIISDDKYYYVISEVAQILGVSETLLRYWEKEFPQQITPKKGSRGVRRYTKEDIEKIRTIYDLVKVRGLKLHVRCSSKTNRALHNRSKPYSACAK